LHHFGVSRIKVVLVYICSRHIILLTIRHVRQIYRIMPRWALLVRLAAPGWVLHLPCACTLIRRQGILLWYFFFINRPRVPSLCKFLYSSIYNQPTIVSLLSWNHETGNLRLTFRYLNPSAPLLLRCCLYCCGLTAPPSPIKHRSLNDLCCQS